MSDDSSDRIVASAAGVDRRRHRPARGCRRPAAWSPSTPPARSPCRRRCGPWPRQGLVETRPGVGTFVRTVRVARGRTTTAGRPPRSGRRAARPRVSRRRCGPRPTTRSPCTPATRTATCCPSAWCAPRSPGPHAATRRREPAAGRRPAGAPGLVRGRAGARRARSASPPPTAQRRGRRAGQPERAELDVPRRSSAPGGRCWSSPRRTGARSRRPPRRASSWCRCPADPTVPTPPTLARAFDRDRSPGLLRPAELRQPDRRPVVADAGATRCSTSCGRTARSWSRTTGRTTSASPRRPSRWPPATTAGTWSTCARSPRACRRPCGSRPSIARGPARERLLVADQARSRCTSAACSRPRRSTWSPSPAWRTHLRGLRQQLRARRDLLVGALARARPDGAPRRTYRPAG